MSLVGLVVCLALAGERLRGLLFNTAWLIGGTWLLSLPVGALLAVMITKTTVPGRRVLEQMFVALLFVPLYVQAAAWQAAVGQGGWLVPDHNGAPWLQGWGGAVWVHGMAATAWVVLFVGAALKNVPRELEEESLQDAGAVRVLWRVSLRRAMAGILAAALWIAVVCAGEIAVTDLFQVRTFAEEIYTVASLGALDVPLSQNAAVVPMVAPQLVAQDLWIGTAAIVLLVSAALGAIWAWLPTVEFVSPSEGWIWRLRRGRLWAALLVWGCTALAIGAPALGLLGKAGIEARRDGDAVVREWSASKAAGLVLASPREHRRELGWSCAIGGSAAALATGVGVLLAWALRTGWLPRAPTALLLAMGFAIPGPLLGVWMIRILNHSPESPWYFLTWYYDHTILAPVLVQTLRALPLATLILGSQLATVPQDVLDSATSEGAGWWRQLVGIALPLRWHAVVAAACLSLVVAVSDLAATLLVLPPGVSTLSVRIFGLLHYGAEDRVSALCLALAVAVGALATLAWQLPRWARRRPKPIEG
ncbi:MAG: iron ABC transporter permease [Planctomycetes bacterium]|nr:iron ABC transporter permease [Planctomycetota bacterium]